MSRNFFENNELQFSTVKDKLKHYSKLYQTQATANKLPDFYKIEEQNDNGDIVSLIAILILYNMVFL